LTKNGYFFYGTTNRPPPILIPLKNLGIFKIAVFVRPRKKITVLGFPGSFGRSIKKIATSKTVKTENGYFFMERKKRLLILWNEEKKHRFLRGFEIDGGSVRRSMKKIAIIVENG
jgi:hypothetical protein